MSKTVREDALRWKAMLSSRRVQRLWHFSPLVCIPSILHHGAILSIEEQEKRGLSVPQRSSRDDDIRNGVGDAVKLSVMPYWRMLSGLMREGHIEVMVEFSPDPVLWTDTFFGNSNVWESCWQAGTTIEFASEKVFVAPSKWDGSSPPEIYVRSVLPVSGTLVKLYTVLEDERAELSNTLDRLGLRTIDVFTAGFSFPFPSAARDEYSKKHAAAFSAVREYLRRLSRDSLSRGVEL